MRDGENSSQLKHANEMFPSTWYRRYFIHAGQMACSWPAAAV